jgi:hypothetical protein
MYERRIEAPWQGGGQTKINATTTAALSSPDGGSGLQRDHFVPFLVKFGSSQSFTTPFLSPSASSRRVAVFDKVNEQLPVGCLLVALLIRDLGDDPQDRRSLFDSHALHLLRRTRFSSSVD